MNERNLNIFINHPGDPKNREVRRLYLKMTIDENNDISGCGMLIVDKVEKPVAILGHRYTIIGQIDNIKTGKMVFYVLSTDEKPILYAFNIGLKIPFRVLEYDATRKHEKIYRQDINEAMPPDIKIVEADETKKGIQSILLNSTKEFKSINEEIFVNAKKISWALQFLIPNL